jgi:hypothetical protein
VISSINVHRFSFENVSSHGYWSLDEVSVTIENRTYVFKDTKVGAPLQFSYHCSQEVIFVDTDNTFNISSGFQVLYFILKFICNSTCGLKLPDMLI